MITRTTKATVRRTSDTVFERGRRDVIVTLGPGALIGFRLSGTRRTYETTARACYMLALQQHLAEQRRIKAAKRKAKRIGGKV